ncbi:hypothetical protein SFUMM280S_07454 [Streptomyces fumanus]
MDAIFRIAAASLAAAPSTTSDRWWTTATKDRPSRRPNFSSRWKSWATNGLLMMCHASSTRKMRFFRSGRIQVCSSHTPTIAMRMGMAMELRSMWDRSKTMRGASRSMPTVVGPSNMPRRSPSTSRSRTRATSRPQARTSSMSTFIASADSGSGCRNCSTMLVSTGWRSTTVSLT